MIPENKETEVRSKTGKKLSEITLQAVMNGEVTAEDIKISKEVLWGQAKVAEAENRQQLAANFIRASEMVSIPDEVILEMYNKLRPHRATKQELLEMASTLQNRYNASNCAALVKEATEVYEKRGILL